MRRAVMLFALVVASAGIGFGGEEAAKSPLGHKVENFTLGDYRGAEHSLSDYADKQAVVLAFLGTECPLAKLYAPRLQKLSAEYGAKGVAVIGVNANSQDSITEIAAYARVHGLEFPVLKDVGNKLADAIGAERTPEVFVLDKDRTVRYWGRIDDQYGIGYARNDATRNDLQIALDQLLAGENIEVAEAKSVGCLIGRVHEPNADSDVTYSNQIARVFQKHCVECHRDGDIAPFALSNYDEVAGWAEMIAEVIEDNRMPPWHANPAHGKFANDRRMSEDEKQLIRDWVANGAPEGDKSQLPEPKTFQVGWQLPTQPDMVIDMAEKPHSVPAEGVVKYQHFTVDPGFTEDHWVKGAEVIPGNRGVVHHILVFVRKPGEQRRGIEDLGFVAAYVPGIRAETFPEGMAKYIPAGSKLVFQVHYTPNGTAQEDISKVGFVFAKPEEVTHMLQTIAAMRRDFEIPPHSDNHEVVSHSFKYDQDLILVGMSPHMHLRGKSFSYEAQYPDGTKEMLLDVPHYDFNWQNGYALAEHKVLPAGTKMHCVAHYDNSENNLANPNPEETVRWGDQTWEEMMIGFYDVAIPVDAKEGKVSEVHPSTESQAEMLIANFDKDGDGVVARDEVKGRGLALFLTLDKNFDGKITIDELTKVLKEREQAERDKKKVPSSQGE